MYFSTFRDIVSTGNGMNPIVDKIFLKLLISPDFRFRLIRHLLLWCTTIWALYMGFRFLSLRIPDSTPASKMQYSVVSTLLFGAMITAAYFVITRTVQKYILADFKIALFLMALISVHIVSAILVMYHFQVFVWIFKLPNLPATYKFYSEHVKDLPFYLAPFDSVIVGIFSFSLYYNYLLYAVGLKAFKDLFTLKVDKTELERQNIQLEYDFLKSQINPHFLFNTLNNIYSFSVISPAKVGDMILKLAALMRYSLYETNEEYVALSKEIDFLESYIALQRVRHEKETRISYDINGLYSDKKITPLLLITFLENAFKHGIQSTTDSNWIIINLKIEGNLLLFNIQNNIDSSAVQNQTCGLGLKNVRKRLDHYYPGRYRLSILETKLIFTVDLKISLDGSTL